MGEFSDAIRIVIHPPPKFSFLNLSVSRKPVTICRDIDKAGNRDPGEDPILSLCPLFVIFRSRKRRNYGRRREMCGLR